MTLSIIVKMLTGLEMKDKAIDNKYIDESDTSYLDKL